MLLNSIFYNNIDIAIHRKAYFILGETARDFEGLKNEFSVSVFYARIKERDTCN